MPEDGRPARLELQTPTGWLPLGFVRDGDVVFLIARERTAQWPVEVLRSGEATLRLPDGPARGRAALITDREARDAAISKFRRAYGPEQFLRWYDRPSRVLRVDLEAPPVAGSSDARYSGWLEAEFDNVADDYDHHILGNRMNRLLRDRSLAQLRTEFAPCHRLLEVGCGSGIETLTMLRDGHEVVAVDVSDRMLEVVRTKARADGLAERLQTVQGRARDLLVLGLGTNGPFDAAYSTYGAMNCEPDLAPVARGFAELLPAGAPLMLGVYNRWCLFELLGYGVSLRPGRALGRRRNPVLVGASRFCIDVFAYSPQDLVAWFGESFERTRLEGVPVVLPPSDLTLYAERFSRRFDRLASLDARIGSHFPWNSLGDHFLATYRRRPSPHRAAAG